MNAFLNILKYGLVVIMVLLALFIIACGCLVLFPGFSLFGISYITYDNKQVETQISATEADSPLVQADIIKINSGIFDVNLDVVDTQKILNGNDFMTCRLSRNLSGFVVGDEEDKKIALSYNLIEDGETKILNLVITQPSRSWLFPTEVALNIFVPNTLLQTKTVEITSTSGTINIGSKPQYNQDNEVTNTFLNMNTLNISNQSGAVNLGCVNLMGDLQITKDSGDVESYLDLQVKTTISIKSSFGNIKLTNVGTESSPKDLVLDGIWNSSVKIGTIYGNFVAKNIGGGLFKIAKLIGESSIENGFADFYVGEVNAEMTYTADDGLFELSTITAKLNLTQQAGTVKIKELGTTSQLLTHTISTSSAGVTIDKLRDSVDVKTQKGDITVNSVPTDTPVSINVSTNDGKVKLLNINGTVTYSCESGSSSAYVEYSNFVGKNTFLNQSGNIEVVMPYDKNPAMWLRWETGNTADIKLFSFESTLKYSSADPRAVIQDGKEYGIAINKATTSTPEILQIATRGGHISVYRQSVAG